MPNWVYQSTHVSKGDPKEVWDAIRGDESLFDFNKLVPAEQVGSASESLNKRMFDRWGVSQNAVNVRFCTKHSDVLLYETLGALPMPVYEALAKKFPAHEFTIYADDYENEIHMTFTLKDGQFVGDEELCEYFG